MSKARNVKKSRKRSRKTLVALRQAVRHLEDLKWRECILATLRAEISRTKAAIKTSRQQERDAMTRIDEEFAVEHEVPAPHRWAVWPNMSYGSRRSTYMVDLASAKFYKKGERNRLFRENSTSLPG